MRAALYSLLDLDPPEELAPEEPPLDELRLAPEEPEDPEAADMDPPEAEGV